MLQLFVERSEAGAQIGFARGERINLLFQRGDLFRQPRRPRIQLDVVGKQPGAFQPQALYLQGDLVAPRSQLANLLLQPRLLGPLAPAPLLETGEIGAQRGMFLGDGGHLRLQRVVLGARFFEGSLLLDLGLLLFREQVVLLSRCSMERSRSFSRRCNSMRETDTFDCARENSSPILRNS